MQLVRHNHHQLSVTTAFCLHCGLSKRYLIRHHLKLMSIHIKKTTYVAKLSFRAAVTVDKNALRHACAVLLEAIQNLLDNVLNDVDLFVTTRLLVHPITSKFEWTRIIVCSKL